MMTDDEGEPTEAETPATTTPTSRFEELKMMVAAMEGDFDKFFGQGNKAAGTRIRAAMQELKTFAQAVRTEVQAMKNEGTKKS